MLHGGFPLFNPTHVGHAWPLVQRSRQFIQLLAGPGGIHLHPTVVFISNPSAQTEAARMMRDEPAESNSLDAAGNEPLARFDRLPGQFEGSAAPTASISA